LRKQFSFDGFFMIRVDTPVMVVIFDFYGMIWGVSCMDGRLFVFRLYACLSDDIAVISNDETIPHQKWCT
jgi:hypothetical protein